MCIVLVDQNTDNVRRKYLQCRLFCREERPVNVEAVYVAMELQSKSEESFGVVPISRHVVFADLRKSFARAVSNVFGAGYFEELFIDELESEGVIHGM